MKEAMVNAEEAMSDWRKAVMTAQPGLSADRVRMVCSSIIVRAKKISQENNLNFPQVAAFLLVKTRDWCVGGTPLEQVIGRLPTNLRELGIMKLAEDTTEVQNIMRKKH